MWWPWWRWHALCRHKHSVGISTSSPAASKLLVALAALVAPSTPSTPFTTPSTSSRSYNNVYTKLVCIPSLPFRQPAASPSSAVALPCTRPSASLTTTVWLDAHVQVHFQCRRRFSNPSHDAHNADTTTAAAAFSAPEHPWAGAGSTTMLTAHVVRTLCAAPTRSRPALAYLPTSITLVSTCITPCSRHVQPFVSF